MLYESLVTRISLESFVYKISLVYLPILLYTLAPSLSAPEKTKKKIHSLEKQ